MKFAIIGGTGKMGRWFARFLLEEGHQVLVIGRDEGKLQEARRELDIATSTGLEAARDADLIIISVPVNAFEGVVQQLQPHVRPGQTIVDVTSVKTMPTEVMHRYLGTNLTLGTHPVFGPGAESLRCHNFVLTPTTEAEAACARKMQGYLEGRGARVTLMTPCEHDDMMAVILGLAHYIAIVSADTLLQSGDPAKMASIAGTTFRLLLTFASSVLSEDPELYATLQVSLPGLADVESRFIETAQSWAGMVRGGDREGFASRMASLKQEMAERHPGFSNAYEKMYRLLSD